MTHLFFSSLFVSFLDSLFFFCQSIYYFSVINIYIFWELLFFHSTWYWQGCWSCGLTTPIIGVGLWSRVFKQFLLESDMYYIVRERSTSAYGVISSKEYVKVELLEVVLPFLERFGGEWSQVEASWAER